MLNWLKEGWQDLKDLALTEVSFESLSVEAQISQFAGQDYKKAIASYNQALKFKTDDHEAWYNKAYIYALQGNIEQILENLQKAINLSPDECREWAKTDSDFDVSVKMSGFKH